MTRPPTVAIVAHGVHDHGGMERPLAELVRRGDGRYRFVVVAAELGEDLRPLVDWRRVRVPMRPIPLKLAAFAAVAGLRLARTRVDLVHVMGAIVPNAADVASVQYCHAGFRERTGSLSPDGAPALRRLNTALKRLLALAGERWCYRTGRVRLLAAASRGIARELERHYPGPPVTVVPNGVDPERFRPDPETRARLRAEEGVGEDDIVALFVGGDWDRKGLAVAIEGLPAGIRLWVVGGGDETRFGAVAERSGAEVRFFGRRSDTERFYAAADVFVLPTLYEAFPLVALEAAAAGLPIVATDANGIEELVGDGEAGVIVERTPAAVEEAIRRLAAESGLRLRLGQAARARAGELTWARISEAMLAEYERLLSEPEPTMRSHEHS